MNNGWTTARQTQQAAAIHHWKPWEKSTGPKSPEGKQKASRNAYKGGVLVLDMFISCVACRIIVETKS